MLSCDWMDSSERRDMDKYTLLFIFLAVSLRVYSQNIPKYTDSKPVIKFIQQNSGVLKEQIPSCENFEACRDYNYTRKDYRFHGDAERGFQKLISLKPNEIWHGSSHFEMEIDSKTDAVTTKNQPLPKIEKGQVFFLELRVIEGWGVKLVKIPVAFQVVELDPIKKTISFSYLNNNKSKGIQKISFIQEGSDFIVKHETRFKSDSAIRDRLIYRFFHNRLLNDVWNDYRDLIE